MQKCELGLICVLKEDMTPVATVEISVFFPQMIIKGMNYFIILIMSS